MEPDELTITWAGDPVRLTILGEVDLATRDQFKAALSQLLGSNGESLLDLAGVTFMDTHSVTVVVQTANRLHDEGGKLVVHEPPNSLRRIFETLWGGGDGTWLHISGRRGKP